MQITDADKPRALAALYNASKPLGMGILQFTPGDMSESDAKALLEERQRFDYLKGRVMKMGFNTGELNFRLYDRDNGEGAGERAVRAALGAS